MDLVKIVVGAPSCPACGGNCDTATVTPRAGDYAVCSHCGELLQWTQACDLRHVTEREMADLPLFWWVCRQVVRRAIEARREAQAVAAKVAGQARPGGQ